MPRAGVNIGDGCWGGHIIEFCDVFDTVKETGDHGSFNSWGRDRYWVSNIKEVNRRVATAPDLPMLDVVEPITLRNNRWRCDHGWDIDLDDGSSNYHIYNNLCLHGGLKNREGFNRVVENNVMVGNTFHPHVWFDNSGDLFQHNIVFTSYKPIGMPQKWGRTVDDNLLHEPSFKTPAAAEALQKLSHQDARSIRANADFISPSSGDYRVRDGSPALALGFKNFPMDQFGVSSPALRAIARTPSLSTDAAKEAARDISIHRWNGVRIRNISGPDEQSAHGLSSLAGVLVVDAPADSLLGKSGVLANDVILRVGGAAVADVQTLLSRQHQTGLTIDVMRDQQVVKLSLKPN